MTIRKLMTTGAVAAVLGICALAATTTVAEARIACSRFGDCWQVRDRYDYPSTLGVRYYGDNWRWRNRGYHWRGYHDGRGYWRNGIWVTF